MAIQTLVTAELSSASATTSPQIYHLISLFYVMTEFKAINMKVIHNIYNHFKIDICNSKQESDHT